MDNERKETFVRSMLVSLGEDTDREGLRDTPKRVVKSWGEIYSGYSKKPEDILTVFHENCDEIVLLKDIELYSMCLAGSTFVETVNGRIPISKVKHGDYVYCYDEEKEEITLAQIEHPRITGRNKRLWRVYTDKDTILCTEDHKFLTFNRGWVIAKELQFGDSVVALNKATDGGNVILYKDTNRISEHRFIYKKLKGKIIKGNHIHHVDGNHFNNHPDNLVSLSSSEHSRIHRLDEDLTGFAKVSTEENISKNKVSSLKGRVNSHSKEAESKRSASMKKRWAEFKEKQKERVNHKVVFVEETDWYEDVWNLEVPKFHNFFANGMLVHNCEHHMLPFYGKAHVAYLPADGRVIGISKLARLVDIYARRLQIQERIGQQVTTALMEILKPKGAACIIEATHMCMRMRGVGKQNSIMTTSSMMGVFREDSATRQELMNLLK